MKEKITQVIIPERKLQDYMFSFRVEKESFERFKEIAKKHNVKVRTLARAVFDAYLRSEEAGDEMNEEEVVCR